MDRQEFGRAGEKRAERFLRGQKHRIVARNYRAKQGEVDIISLAPDRTLVFTEVRSKHDCTYGHPLETRKSSSVCGWRRGSFSMSIRATAITPVALM